LREVAESLEANLSEGGVEKGASAGGAELLEWKEGGGELAFGVIGAGKEG
jgi:hypothetical protein